MECWVHRVKEGANVVTRQASKQETEENEATEAARFAAKVAKCEAAVQTGGREERLFTLAELKEGLDLILGGAAPTTDGGWGFVGKLLDMGRVATPWRHHPRAPSPLRRELGLVGYLR